MKKFVGDVVKEYCTAVRKILISDYNCNHKQAENMIENSDFYRYLYEDLRLVELSSPEYWAETVFKNNKPQ